MSDLNGIRRVLETAAVAVLCALAAGCAPPTSPGTPAGPPAIHSLRFHSERTDAPVVGVLRWSISDPNGDQLSCRIDVDGNGTVDHTFNPCSSSDSVLLQMDHAETRTATLQVSDSDFAPVSESVEMRTDPGPTEDFRISLRLDPGMDPIFKNAFQNAANRWEEVITAGVPDVPLDLPAGLLGWNPGFNGVVDDVLIDARDIPMDGPGRVLGSAGGILIREGHWQPYYGIMEFDTEDLQRLEDQGSLDDVILHEMGHVLGLGPSWIIGGRLTDLFTNPGYTGLAGVAAYRELGGSGPVPVEDGGRLGTVLAHWRESTFDDELMTGYLGLPPTKLSRVTIAALADQGYGVDLGAADPYTLPSGALRNTRDPFMATDGDSATQKSLHTEAIPPMLDGIPG